MSTESQQGPQIAATLMREVGRGADAAHIADAIVSRWLALESALAPILGRKGVAAIYKRSLYLAGRDYPWLAAAYEGTQEGGDFTAPAPAVLGLPILRSVLTQQSSADAAAGGGALLQIFHELLASLIGPSLTERLLRPVWAESSSGSPAQDTSS